MSGWFIHLDVARKALVSLADDPDARELLTERGGLVPEELVNISESEPAYLALGAIGPDLFFLLPDFKPPYGNMLWSAANTVREIYTWLDDNLLEPLSNQLGPVSGNFGDLVNAASGGVLNQLSDISSRALSFFVDGLKVTAVRQFDVMSLLSSGVPNGFDEQTFFWSDMLHYRQTYRVALRLWQLAAEEPDPTLRRRFQAYALGWMGHLGTDVITHTFVNQKVGGPYRLHWVRHHLVENHMDARIYDAQRGTEALYGQMGSAALHLWIAFHPDGSSRVNCFADQPGPDYGPGTETPDHLDRHSKWDVDPIFPQKLGELLARTLRDVYSRETSTSDWGQEACCPTIISALDDRVPIEEGGYATAEDIEGAYWNLFHYIKFITTDYYKLKPPSAPELIPPLPFPSPPGTGAVDDGPGASDDSFWEDLFEVLAAIFAWILYIGEVIAWVLTAPVAVLTGVASYPARQMLYEYVQVPLYNAWLALHYYLAMTGIVMPLPHEINLGLTKLGTSVEGSWPEVLAALDMVDGGLISASAHEPSGADRQIQTYPLDAVTDKLADLPRATNPLTAPLDRPSRQSSEFLNPWQFPERNRAGDAVPIEHPTQVASPYDAGTDVLDMLASMPGTPRARDDLESAGSEMDTRTRVSELLSRGESLGDPIDYVRYLFAKLTTSDVSTIANFNLDADRGYGTLAWDWVRDPLREKESPKAFEETINPSTGVADDISERRYRVPKHPGFGAEKVPYDPTDGGAVQIRYIDRESKERNT